MNFNIKNTKMSIYFESLLDSLNEAKVSKKEIFNYNNDFIKQRNQSASKISKDLKIPYDEYKYLKEPDVEKLVELLDKAKLVKDSIVKKFNEYLKDKNIKSLKAGLVALANSMNFNRLWSITQGHFQAPAKMAFIEFLNKKYNIYIPVKYTGIDRDPEKVKQMIQAKLYPVYPLHLLVNFIELQVLAEFVKAKKIDDKTKNEIMESIYGTDKIKSEMIEYTNNDKSGFKDEVIDVLNIETTPSGVKYSLEPLTPQHSKEQRKSILNPE